MVDHEYATHDGTGHPSAEDVAAYLDGRIGVADRERIEGHAAVCDHCRRELAEVTRVLGRTRRGRRWRLWAPLAAAAAVIAIAVAQPFGIRNHQAATPVRFRGSDAPAGGQGAMLVGVVSPSADGTVDPAALTFVWHQNGRGTSFQLTLTDGDGSVVWTRATTDTEVTLPDSVTLARGSPYHWYVDAMLDDGRRASSGVHSFTTVQ